MPESKFGSLEVHKLTKENNQISDMILSRYLYILVRNGKSEQQFNHFVLGHTGEAAFHEALSKTVPMTVIIMNVGIYWLRYT